jgi:hypothetical protein
VTAVVPALHDTRAAAENDGVSGLDYVLLTLAWALLAALVVNPAYAVASRLTDRLPRHAMRRHALLEACLVIAYAALLTVGILLSGPPF